MPTTHAFAGAGVREPLADHRGETGRVVKFATGA